MTLTPDPSWAAFYAHLEESLGDVQAHRAIRDLEAAEDTAQGWGPGWGTQRRRMPGHPQSHWQVGHRSLWGICSTDADKDPRLPAYIRGLDCGLQYIRPNSSTKRDWA